MASSGQLGSRPSSSLAFTREEYLYKVCDWSSSSSTSLAASSEVSLCLFLGVCLGLSRHALPSFGGLTFPSSGPCSLICIAALHLGEQAKTEVHAKPLLCTSGVASRAAESINIKGDRIRIVVVVRVRARALRARRTTASASGTAIAPSCEMARPCTHCAGRVLSRRPARPARPSLRRAAPGVDDAV